MSGHSHWARIKRKKGVTDARRGKLFSKLAKHLMSAARQGGSDPNMNLRLRYAIEKSREASMSRESIERAIEKGAGGETGADFEQILYEGYGPGGVAVLTDILTDNRNRTSPEIRRIFEDHGGNLGGNGCVAWCFDKKGVMAVESKGDSEKIFEIALEYGADNVDESEGELSVVLPVEAFEKCRQALTQKGYPPISAKLQWVPKSLVPVSGDNADRLLALLSALEDHEDVEEVASNFDLPEDLIKY